MYRTAHADIRAEQRYGFVPTEAEWAGAICSITSSIIGIAAPAMRLRRQKSGIEEWAVRVGGVAMRVVYCSRTASVITVLPPS